METKNYTEVLIDGKIYTMGGYEEEGYLQRVAAYLNARIGECKQQNGFNRLPAELRNIQVYLNLADDYFKVRKVAEDATQRLGEQEKELYQLKHELITLQLKLEQLQHEKDLQSEQERDGRTPQRNGSRKQGGQNHQNRPNGQNNQNHQKGQYDQPKQYMPSEE